MNPTTTACDSRAPEDARFDAAVLFTLAFFARLLVILQLRSDVLFSTPIVDAAAYADQARALAAGAPVTEALFWQPIFYPLYLSLVFRLAGPSLLAARLAQALLGSASCVLVYLLARRLGRRRTGLLAGLLLAFYGPVIALETDLLSEGWAVFWAALLLWLFTGAEPGTRPARLGLLGACGGLAILTRPTFIPFVGGAAFWLTWKTIRARGWKPGLDAATILAAGLLLVLLPAAALCRERTGRFTVLPSSSGVNLFLGNNPHWIETVSIRPGVEWTELFREPQRAGLSDPWDQSDYFRQKVADYVRARPDAFGLGLLQKTARFFCSREIPRNHDLYLLRDASPWLGVLMWKFGGLGFPFGVLFPLALIGLATQGRRLGAPALLFLGLYSISVILVFVSDRYRLPLVPALAVAAALGLHWCWTSLASRRWGRGFAGLAAAAAVAALISVPRHYPEERLAFDAERHWAVGKRLASGGEAADAEAHLRRAAEINPAMLDAWNDLGVLLEKAGRGAEAIESYRRAVALAPLNAGLRYNLGAALLEAGRSEEATQELGEAVRLDPDYAPAHTLYDAARNPAPARGN